MVENNEEQNVENNEDVLMSDAMMGNFKEWLKVVGLNPDEFSEEMYKQTILNHSFSQYSMHVAEHMKQQNEEQDNPFNPEKPEQNTEEENVIQFPNK